MVRIVTVSPAESIIYDWSQYAIGETSLGISKEFEERAFDGSSIFNVLELSTSFIVGVGSGMLANWLGSILTERKVKNLKIGRRTFNPPLNEEIAKSEIIMEIRLELDELKRKTSNNEK